jgi:alpha-tubulin suppressor-like RCC1 family protein
VTRRALSAAISMMATLVLVVAGVAATSQAAAKPKPYKVKISLSATSTTVGSPVTVSGSVKPKATGKKVKLQELVAGKWKEVRKAELRKKSKYSFTYTPSSAGSHQLRVQKGGGGGYKKGFSKTLTLTATNAGGGGGTGSGIDVGRWHTCVIVGGGSIKCWGINDQGQLGNGTTNASNPNPTPVTVQGITSATALGLGWSTSCAVVGGQVKCWGDNFYGEFGSGATGADSSVPVTVPGISNAVAVDAGFQQVCALLSTGSVMCWGRNFSGVIGNPAVPVDTIVGPTQVSGITTATALSVNAVSGCALLANHTVSCWGINTEGQLGDGTEDPRTAPVLATGINDATAIAVGGYHACAVVTGGAVKCWGYNLSGATGVANPPEEVHTPTAVPGVSGATSVSAGEYHSCAVVGGGAMTCWGANDHGQMGTGGTTVLNTPPTAVTGLSGVTVANGAGNWHSCALLGSGAVRCWGSNFYGQIGSGNPSNGLFNAPVAVVGVP